MAENPSFLIRVLVLQKAGFLYLYDSYKSVKKKPERPLRRSLTLGILPIGKHARPMPRNTSFDVGRQAIVENDVDMTKAATGNMIHTPEKLKEKVFGSLPLKVQTKSFKIREDEDFPGKSGKEPGAEGSNSTQLMLMVTLRITNHEGCQCDFACVLLVKCTEREKVFIYSHFSLIQTVLNYLSSEVERLAQRLFFNPKLMDSHPEKDSLPRYVLNFTPSFVSVVKIVEQSLASQIGDEIMQYPVHIASRAFPELRSEIEELFILTLKGVYGVDKWKTMLERAITAVLSTHGYWVNSFIHSFDAKERYSLPSSSYSAVDQLNQNISMTTICSRNENLRLAFLNVLSFFLRTPSLCRFYAFRSAGGDRISPGSLVEREFTVSEKPSEVNSSVIDVEFPIFNHNYRTMDSPSSGAYDTYGSSLFSSKNTGLKNGSSLYPLAVLDTDDLLVRLGMIAKYSEVDAIHANVVDLNEQKCVSFTVDSVRSYQGETLSAIISSEEDIMGSKIVRRMLEDALKAFEIGVPASSCVEYLELRLVSLKTLCEAYREHLKAIPPWKVMTYTEIKELLGKSALRSLTEFPRNELT